VNDHDDFERFVRRTSPSMLAFAIWYCRDRQQAEDAVQEAYLEAFGHWDSLEQPEAWMRTTVRRKLIREAERWRLWRRRAATVVLPVPASSGVEEEAEALAVLRAVHRLPARQRQVVVMHCFEGMAYREIATTLRITVGAVGANLAKAREKLAIALGTTPARWTPGDPFVTAPAGLRTDPLAVALRATGAWLTRGFEDDSATVARLHEAVVAVVRRERGST
jgi:RNA polymerase sigma-70 factor (ECF subfamily)